MDISVIALSLLSTIARFVLLHTTTSSLIKNLREKGRSSLLRITSTKSNIHMKMVPMPEIRGLLEDTLQSEGFNAGLENMTETEINYKVSGPSGYLSRLSLNRQTHRPLEVELEIDFNYYRAQKEAFKQQSKRNRAGQNNRSSMYRMFWIIWIFGGILVGILYIVAQIILAILEAITPGLSTGARSIVFGLLGLLAIIIWIFGVPAYLRNQDQRNSLYDQKVLDIVKNSLIHYDKEKSEVSQLKCWNCFKTIGLDDIHCAYCGKKQK